MTLKYISLLRYEPPVPEIILVPGVSGYVDPRHTADDDKHNDIALKPGVDAGLRVAVGV